MFILISSLASITIIFFLFICLILALYSHFFNDGEAINFEEAYKGALKLVTDIGQIFADMKENVVNTMQTIMELPEKICTWFEDFFEKIGQFFTNLGNRIGQFFTNIINEIITFFGGEPIDCGCEEDCIDCASDRNTDGVHCGKIENCSCSLCVASRGRN